MFVCLECCRYGNCFPRTYNRVIPYHIGLHCCKVWNAADMATVFQESYNSILFHIILASTVYLSFSASGFHGRLGINRVDRKLFRFRAFFQNISIQIYFHFLTKYCNNQYEISSVRKCQYYNIFTKSSSWQP